MTEDNVSSEEAGEKITLKNPNNIGMTDVMAFTVGDVLMSEDMVYRTVSGANDEMAIKDLFSSGVVRGKQGSQYGESVYWNRGKNDRYHNFQTNGFLIVAPLSIASERQITKDDVVAIYKKYENGEVKDVLAEYKQKAEAVKAELDSIAPSKEVLDK